MTRLSIIIVSWNTRELLAACLASIYRQPPHAPFEVIIVDNASGDGSRERVRREFPAALLIENPANLGFAAASNRGAATAMGSYLLFLNSDTRVHAGTLDSALSFMERHPRAGVMGCRTMDDGGSPQGTALGFPTPARVFANISGLSRMLRFPRLRRQCRRRPDYIQGSFLVIPKRVFDHCGGFDERFFLYGEDADLCLRVREAGLAIEYDPTCAITHHGGGSSGEPAARIGHFITGCLQLYGKHRSPRQRKRLTVFIRSALALRLLAGSLAAPQGFAKRKRETGELFRRLAAAEAGGGR
jgi:GT2 family glycosyltransferase